MTIFYKKILIDLDNSYSIGKFSSESDQVWWFTEDEANRDYQEYLAWIADGNEPEIINEVE